MTALGTTRAFRRTAQALPLIVPTALIYLVAFAVPPTLPQVYGISFATLLWVTFLLISLLNISLFREWLRHAPLLLVLVLPALSTLLAREDLRAVIPGGLSPLIGMTLGFILIFPALNRRTLPQITHLLLALSGLAAALAFYQQLTHSWPVLDAVSLPEFTSAAFENRAASTFGHPILYGTFAGTMAICALHTRIWWRWYAVGWNVLGLLVSGSRSAIIPLGIVVAILCLVRTASIFKARKISLSGVLVIWFLTLSVFSLVAAFNLGVISLPDRYSKIGESYSALYRFQQWEAGFKLVTASPQSLWIGHGIGGSVALFNKGPLIDLWGPKTFDNAAVTLLYDFGVLGLLMFYGVLLYGVLSRGRALGRYVLLFLLMDSFFFDAYLWPIYLLLVFLGFALRRYSPDRETRGVR